MHASVAREVLFPPAADPTTNDDGTPEKALADLMELKNTCIHPTSQKPYIRSYTGGWNNSTEGLEVSPFSLLSGRAQTDWLCGVGGAGWLVAPVANDG